MPRSLHLNSFNTRCSAAAASAGEGLLNTFLIFPTISALTAGTLWASRRWTATISVSNSSVLAMCFQLHLFPRLAHLNSLIKCLLSYFGLIYISRGPHASHEAALSINLSQSWVFCLITRFWNSTFGQKP